MHWITLNSLPNDTILDSAKLKAFADDKCCLNVLIFFFFKLENEVGRGENDDYQHFLLFQQCFQKASYSRSSKTASYLRTLKPWIVY